MPILVLERHLCEARLRSTLRSYQCRKSRPLLVGLPEPQKVFAPPKADSEGQEGYGVCQGRKGREGQGRNGRETPHS